jgi:hypothetical protein
VTPERAAQLIRSEALRRLKNYMEYDVWLKEVEEEITKLRNAVLTTDSNLFMLYRGRYEGACIVRDLIQRTLEAHDAGH